MQVGYIYEIYDKSNVNQFLIGSTTNSLKTTKSKFLYEIKNYSKRNKRVNKDLLHAIGTIPLENWDIKQIGFLHFVNRSELRELTDLYIQQRRPPLNSSRYLKMVGVQNVANSKYLDTFKKSLSFKLLKIFKNVTKL